MSKNSLILVLQNKQEGPTIDMAKVQIKSEKLTPFGGIFSIMEQFDSTLSSVIDSTLGLRCGSFHFMACFRGQSVCSCNRMSDILCEPVFLLLSSFQVISLDGFILWSIMIYRKVFPLSKWRGWLLSVRNCVCKSISSEFAPVTSKSLSYTT